MLLITCPVTKTDELVADRRIRSVVNHPTHIAMTVECPCGGAHVYRTGRRWETARRASSTGRSEDLVDRPADHTVEQAAGAERARSPIPA